MVQEISIGIKFVIFGHIYKKLWYLEFVLKRYNKTNKKIQENTSSRGWWHHPGLEGVSPDLREPTQRDL